MNQKRVFLVAGATTLGYTATMIGLNELWYKDFPRRSFHFYNDNSAWKQMDKFGHALTAYQLGRYGYEVLKWTGTDERKSVWIGGSFGLFFLTSIEVLDGFSSEWGFSSGDFIANTAGTALFIGQQLTWKEQRIALKFSYSASEYARYRPETLGSGGMESVLKDYNGQTIWLSVNPSSFIQTERHKRIPWLNVAFGYSANGMLGGDENPEFNSSGELIPVIEPYRQFFVSLDLDLSRIETNSHFLKTLFSVVGFIKIPAPAIEFSKGNATWHWLYF